MMVGKHEHRRVIRRLWSPPSLPVQIPVSAAGPEHVASHDVGARVDDSVDLGVVLVGVIEHPGVQPAVDAFAERQVLGLVRACGVAIQGHGDVCGDYGHAGTDYRRPRKSSNPLCSVSVRGIVD